MSTITLKLYFLHIILIDLIMFVMFTRLNFIPLVISRIMSYFIEFSSSRYMFEWMNGERDFILFHFKGNRWKIYKSVYVLRENEEIYSNFVLSPSHDVRHAKRIFISQEKDRKDETMNKKSSSSFSFFVEIFLWRSRARNIAHIVIIQ